MRMFSAIICLSIGLCWAAGAIGQVEPPPGYSIGAHSGVVKLLGPDDLRRKITVTRTLTHHVKAAGGPGFEISYADVDQGTGGGFDHPGQGAARRNVAQEVFEYLSTLLAPQTGTARVQFELSATSSDDFFAGQAFPFFPGYPCDQGFQRPLMFRAIVSNEHIGDIDGSIQLNFGPNFSYNTDSSRVPGASQLDLYSLILHEATHALGFLGFAFDPQGLSRIVCDRQFALPNFVASINSENNQRLWQLVNGIPTFVGDPDVDLTPTAFHYIDLPGISPAITRLDKSRLLFEGEILQIFSGHWHTSVGDLMSARQPDLGSQSLRLSPATIRMLDEAIGYGKGVQNEFLGLTGSWFDPASAGQGFNIQFISANRFIIYFYGFLDNGERLWLLGDFGGTVSFQTPLVLSMLEVKNGAFNNFVAENITVDEWGTLTINFVDCENSTATLSGVDGEQIFNLVKLSGVEGLACQ